ncbi:MAG: hypothetical protein K9J16_04255 [Melioribacteraceae bacterium]|nr:hypothetical protein [Melioribacteraceae bacterium]MCF8353669.1 hypothetical protein [Melioribacteraceae bacterium]MCF8394451.1 hypothetical protein [Melioribacteraceae bacterium]MCF8418585.1 hypothetical protein [Melioribacteraceae bacterium]
MDFLVYILTELGFNGIALAYKDKKLPAKIKHVFKLLLLSFAAGIISLFLYPSPIIRNELFRLIAMFIFPVVSAAAAEFIRKNISALRMRFNSGIAVNVVVFIFVVMFVRFLWAV